MNSATPSARPAIRIPKGLPRPPMMATAKAFSPSRAPISEWAKMTGATRTPARPARIEEDHPADVDPHRAGRGRVEGDRHEGLAEHRPLEEEQDGGHRRQRGEQDEDLLREDAGAGDENGRVAEDRRDPLLLTAPVDLGELLQDDAYADRA